MNEVWSRDKLSADRAVVALKAAAEPTRLRILALLAKYELTVKDLTHVLGQSQPRISRHLKLLGEAGLIDRFREGGWVNLRLAELTAGQGVAGTIVSWLDAGDDVLRRDAERARALIEDRARHAQTFFEAHAGAWDELRALHMDGSVVEAAMSEVLGSGPFGTLLDLGTGTGRILELFAPLFERGIGIDTNQSMLSYARSRIEKVDLRHAQVRHGDIYNLSLPDGTSNVIIMHQVLHFLSEPKRAIAEAARVLAPNGRLLIVDFAPHDREAFRERFAHTHLGIPEDRLSDWIAAAGLRVETTDNVLPAEQADDGQSQLRVLIWLARKPEQFSPDATHPATDR
ncbi:MAG: metalloregulator ArsR/SmtB family transcription factor [Pseudomonadota bacterium]